MPPRKRKISSNTASSDISVRPQSPNITTVPVRPRIENVLQGIQPGLETISTRPQHRIFFRHPGYPAPNNILLVVPAPDHPSGGLHHDTALTACGIVSGNRWDGWFTQNLDGPRIDIGPDEILLAGNYYFHLPRSESDPPYGIVPCFRQWVFPHGKLPRTWMQSLIAEADRPIASLSNYTADVTSRDVSCRICAFSEGVQVAHIAPRNELNWFFANGMGQYFRSCMAINMDDTGNCLLLRADLHTSFDARKFIFVPKGTTSKSPSFVTHIIEISTILASLYQNVALQPLINIPVEFLFVRFAWAIFPYLEQFFMGAEENIGVLVNSKYERTTPEKGRQLIKDSASRPQTPKTPVSPGIPNTHAASPLQSISGDYIDLPPPCDCYSEIYASGANTKCGLCG